MFLSSSIDLGNLSLDVFPIILILKKILNKELMTNIEQKQECNKFFACSTHLVIITSSSSSSSSSYLKIIILPTFSFAFPIREISKERISSCTNTTGN